MRTRTLRVGGAVIVLGVVIWSVYPYLTGHVSSSAVVNAPLIRVASAIDGRVEVQPSERGTPVYRGAELVRVETAQRDRRYVSELEASLAHTREQLAAIALRIDAFTVVRDELKQRVANYQTGMVQRLAAEVAEAEAKLKAGKARLVEVDLALQRQQRLFANGNISKAVLDAAEAAAIAAREQHIADAARIEAIRVEHDSANRGSFVGNGWNDVPYSQQRDDEIQLRLIDLEAQKRELESTLMKLEWQIANENARLLEYELFVQNATVNGVIWSVGGRIGDTVRSGDQLVDVVDCDNAFLEVNLDDRYFGSIKVGDAARIQLSGAGGTIKGRVTAIRGAGAYTDSAEYAARTAPRKQGQLTVLVSLPKNTLVHTPGTFCNVGRLAEVYFGPDGSGVSQKVAEFIGTLPSTIAAKLQR